MSEEVVEDEESQLEDAPSAFPNSEDEEEDEGEDDEETELEHAARAGIRLLEENAQLQEELLQVQEQFSQAETEKEELLRLVADKDVRETQLSEHLRKSIRENQSLLSELKAKFDEADRRNSVLGRELASAHKQIGELKPLHFQLRESELELQMLRAKVEDQTRELVASVEEREEERELIQSLRYTIEIYQALDDPCAAKLDEMRSVSTREDDDTSGASPSQLLPPDIAHPAFDDRFSLRDENDRLLAELDHLGQQVLNLKLLEGISRTVRSPKKPPQPGASFVFPSAQDQDNPPSTVGPVGYGTSSRMRFLEQQVSVLQDLLQRFRVQWKYECATRRTVENDKADLLQRMEKMQVHLKHQCTACEKEREDLMAEGDDTSWENSAAVYETLLDHSANCQTREEQAEAEHICFSILRRLVDSWTTDKAKRMRLHDWLTNAIRGTGNRRPLYLYELSGEIASGFQVLLVPILREKFGVQVHVEKRLRNVIVTDLKMQVTGTDAAKAKACLQRISRSLMWLIDVESALIEDQEWVGDFARRKAAKMCANI
ncbi:hypothetical protein BBO99_00005073 [Phytophthora kernoviae]|uniref:G protein gamma domain-containing protein n=1 Tax=Phytophthora kernoviae TaxID=325452 RepID=A0A3R7GWN9_9STRA|nr:hypothetical protein JM16_005156 [Phytophthora kernoviae]RLN26745.1 hypothetical protein BBI17_004276 [Phytophthora kernoviae]RLN79720.1 hypothetical protein BBO99_00005073 [Phytophthora kernoviae]